jgi:hypothetical protein
MFVILFDLKHLFYYAVGGRKQNDSTPVDPTLDAALDAAAWQSLNRNQDKVGANNSIEHQFVHQLKDLYLPSLDTIGRIYPSDRHSAFVFAPAKVCGPLFCVQRICCFLTIRRLITSLTVYSTNAVEMVSP